jgi:bile acid:Na+ symporter, BASS family
VTEMLSIVFKASLVIFMAGNLLDMGLRLRIQDALVGFRNRRFVIQSLLWSFVLCPALAWVATLVVPLEPPYAMGLLLVSMAPCAPFLPMVVERAKGDLGYTASFMFLAAVGTVVYMPLAVPFVVKGVSVSAWEIAKPLLTLVLAPLAVGMATFRAAPAFASRFQPLVKRITGIATLIMLASMLLLYGKGFLGSAGSYATATLVGYLVVVAAASYGLAFRLAQDQKSVLSLGVCTRNAGAALAALGAVPDVDPRAIIVAALTVPIMLIISLAAARWFAGRVGAASNRVEART